MLNFTVSDNLRFLETIVMNISGQTGGISPYSSNVVCQTLTKIREVDTNEMVAYLECFFEDSRGMMLQNRFGNISAPQVDAIFQVIMDTVLNKREVFAEFLEAMLIIKDKPRGHEMRCMTFTYNVEQEDFNCTDADDLRSKNRSHLHPTTRRLFKLCDRLIRVYPGLEQATEDTFEAAASWIGMVSMKVYFFFAGYQDGGSTVRQLEARKQVKMQERNQSGVGASNQPHPPPFTLEEVEHSSVRQLKAFLISRGINPQAFLEKSEMIERAKAELAASIEPPQSPSQSRAPTAHQQSTFQQYPQASSTQAASCRHCRMVGAGLKQCSRCKSAWYCSSECQRKDWKDHKKSCVRP